MGSLAIVKPHAVVATDIATSGATYRRLLSPNPKEAYVVPAGASWFDIDFGSVVPIDTLFAGYHPAGINCAIHLEAIANLATPAIGRIMSGSGPAPGFGPPNHTFQRLAAPDAGRFVRVVFDNLGAAFPLGVIAVGAAFSTEFGQEWGAGQFIEDTGTAERLKGGGFATDPGVATTGWQFTLPALSDLERRQLFQLVKDRRTTKSVLVVENDDQTDGLNERIHWGLFRKLEPFERIDPIDTKWGLQIWDWA